MSENIKLFISRKTVLPESIEPAIIIVSNGKIKTVLTCADDTEITEKLKNYPDVESEDFGSLVLMPGLVDSHVHVNEPGRNDWEGFRTATRAAAAGGVTTIVDMPLNAIPPTTTLENLKTKAQAAHTQLFVDVGFWGGVVPGNQNDLKSLIEAGVVGFKCFLCPSGVDEFPHVNEDDVRKALSELQNSNSVLAFHAECERKDVPYNTTNGDPNNYDTYLQTRPASMEEEAIGMIVKLCEIYKCRCHIVHLSAGEALNSIREAKQKKLLLTVETCYHYLYLSAEKIPRSATQFKCCPPIRDENNREELWQGIKDGTLDMVVSDHSPSPSGLKGKDFLRAWGGISSLQFGLSLLWTESRRRQLRLSLHDVTRLLSAAPARLCGLQHRKGTLSPGLDADFVVWDPQAAVQIRESEILHKHKLTPYLGEKLYGKVFATVVRGNTVYKDGQLGDEPLGQLLLRDSFLSGLFAA